MHRCDHNECCGHSNDRIGAEIGMLHNLLRRQMACMTEKSANSANVTGMQAMIVHHLILREKEGDLFQKDIESAFQMRRSTATGILQLMEQHGILRREPVAHDGRLKRLVLTDRARDGRTDHRAHGADGADVAPGNHRGGAEGLVCRQRENSLQSGAVPGEFMQGGTEKW